MLIQIKCRTFFIIFLLFLSSTIFASECGGIGYLRERIKDCNQEYSNEFELISRLKNGKTFWFDKNTKLAWHYPFASSMATGDYSEIKKLCKRPYRLPSSTQLKNLTSYNSLPFKLETNKVIIKKRRTGTNYQNIFDYYYDFNLKKRKSNRSRQSDMTKYHILCVADLENYFLLERTR